MMFEKLKPNQVFPCLNPLMISHCLRDKTNYWILALRPHLIQFSASSQPLQLSALPDSLWAPASVLRAPPSLAMASTHHRALAYAPSSFWKSFSYLLCFIVQVLAHVTILGMSSLITRSNLTIKTLLASYTSSFIALVTDIILYFVCVCNYIIKFSFPKLEM